MGHSYQTGAALTPADLRAARKTLGMTQAKFAEALGLGAKTRISSMENGGPITRQTAAIVQALLRIKALEEALRECADDLEIYINAEYPISLRDEHASYERGYRRDMLPVVRARAALAVQP